MHDVVIILLNLLAIPIVLLTIVGVWLYCIYAFKQFKLWCGLKNINYTRKKLRLKKIKEQVRTKISRKEPFFDRFYRWTNEHYIITGFIASIIVAGLFVVVMVVYEILTSIGCCCCSHQYITSDERVVLAFVGILATFVVITNHAQSTERIKQLEKMLTNKETELRLAIDEQESNYKKEVNTAIQEVKKSHMWHTYEFIEACQDQLTYKLSKSLADDIRNKQKLTYTIGLGRGQKSMTAKVHIQERVVFFTSTVSPFELISAEEINTINGVIYNQDFVNIIVSTLLQLKKEEGK